MAGKRKKRGGDDGGDSPPDDNFAVMFTSLNLILLSFFILLSSIAVLDDKRTLKVLGSLRGSFGILEGGENPVKEGTNLTRVDPMVSGEKSTFENEVASELEQLAKRSNTKHGAQEVALVQTSDGLQLTFSKRIMFRPGATELNPRIYPMLDRVAHLLAKFKLLVVVRGYTDPKKPRDFPSNVELSSSRAVRVARYLVEAAGMEPQYVRAEGRSVSTRHLRGQRFVELFIPSESLVRRLEVN